MSLVKATDSQQRGQHREEEETAVTLTLGEHPLRSERIVPQWPLQQLLPLLRGSASTLIWWVCSSGRAAGPSCCLYITKRSTIISTYKLLVTWERIKLWSEKEYFYPKYQILQASTYLLQRVELGSKHTRAAVNVGKRGFMSPVGIILPYHLLHNVILLFL